MNGVSHFVTQDRQVPETPGIVQGQVRRETGCPAPAEPSARFFPSYPGMDPLFFKTLSYNPVERRMEGPS